MVLRYIREHGSRYLPVSVAVTWMCSSSLQGQTGTDDEKLVARLYLIVSTHKTANPVMAQVSHT